MACSEDVKWMRRADWRRDGGCNDTKEEAGHVVHPRLSDATGLDQIITVHLIWSTNLLVWVFF